MVLKFFRSNQVFVLFPVLLWMIATWLIIKNFAIQNIVFRDLYPNPITDYFTIKSSFFTSSHVVRLLFYSLVFINAIYLNRIVLKYSINNSTNYLPAIFYLVFSVPAIQFQESIVFVVLSNTLFLICIDLLFNTSNINTNTIRYLGIGLIFSVSSFFYGGILFLIPFLFYAQYNLKHTRWREIIYTKIGLALPFLYFFALGYVFDIDTDKFLVAFKSKIVLRQLFDFSQMEWLIFSSTIILYLIASYVALDFYGKIKIINRKYFNISFFLFVNLLATTWIYLSAGREIFIFFAIPSSVLFSVFFSKCRITLLTQLMFVILTIFIPFFWLIYG